MIKKVIVAIHDKQCYNEYMNDNFGSLKEQAKRLLNIVQDGDHPLHETLVEIITIKQLENLIDLSNHESNNHI